jgi:hypothetical protein
MPYQYGYYWRKRYANERARKYPGANYQMRCGQYAPADWTLFEEDWAFFVAELDPTATRLYVSGKVLIYTTVPDIAWNAVWSDPPFYAVEGTPPIP